MDKVVRTQIVRILAVYAGLVGLVAWQNHFVAAGIAANPYLNVLIIGVFLFGSAKGLLNLADLANEGTALQALKEAYSDAVGGAARTAEDPLWRHLRCFKPARRFRRPNILGPIYDLALDEIRRSSRVRISLDTMQNLLGTVDRKIADERSLIGYLTGLCIFLGLIGTFIGLMEMVGSVGGIIGGLARTEDANPDTIKQLIRDLEAPLVGMATGFSASLFGLFSSLVLGLLGRFTDRTTGIVREELEAWLGSMASIENEREVPVEDGAAGGVAVRGPAPAGMLAMLVGSRRSEQVVDRATRAITLVAERQVSQNGLLAELCRRFDAMAGDHRVLHQALAQSLSVNRDLADLKTQVRQGLDGLQERLDTSVLQLEAGLVQQVETLGHRWSALEERQADVLGQVLQSGNTVEALARRVDDRAAAHATRLAEELRALRAGLDTLAVQGAAAAERAEAGQGSLVALLASGEEQRIAEAGARRRDVERMTARLDQIRHDLASQSSDQAARFEATGTAIARVATALSDEGARRAADLGERLSSQTTLLQELGAEVAQATGRVRDLATGLGEAEAVRSNRELERDLARNALVDRLARHQGEIAQALEQVAQAVTTDRKALSSGLRDALALGFSETARAVVAQQRDLGTAVSRLAEQQVALGRIATESLDVGTLAQGLKAIGDQLDRRLESGFDTLGRRIADSAEAIQILAASADPLPAGVEEPPPSPPLAATADIGPHLARLFQIARGTHPVARA